MFKVALLVFAAMPPVATLKESPANSDPFAAANEDSTPPVAIVSAWDLDGPHPCVCGCDRTGSCNCVSCNVGCGFPVKKKIKKKGAVKKVIARRSLTKKGKVIQSTPRFTSYPFQRSFQMQPSNRFFGGGGGSCGPGGCR